MRHLWSLLAGLVAAPLAWLFLATGQYRSSQTVANWNATSTFDTADLIGPAAFLAGAGILLGLLGTLRWSPAGPLVAGLLLVTPTVFMFINPFETLDAFSVDQPRRLLSQDFQPWLPVENGTLLVLGALLLMAVFSAQRWRRWPAGPAAAAPAVIAERPSAGDQPQPMSDEEILAAAAEMEQEERAAAGGDGTATEADPPEPTTPEPAPARGSESDGPVGESADPATEPAAEPARAQDPDPDPAPPDRDSESSSSRSGASGTG
jgi:hypothetical protein